MASNTICLPVLSILFLLFALSEAREVTVDGWTVENSDHLTKWTHRHHFTTGDVLIWKTSTPLGFEPPVLEVTKEAYESCEISNPLKANVTEVTLNPAGLFYFISGVKELCDKGLKITVKVHGARKHYGAPTQAPALAPETNNMAAEPAAPPTSAASHGLMGGGFMGFVAIGVAGVVGMALNV
ncbi:putative cupredoxin [Rosa chinensis]|uniref:Putative cupredoxin n=1 Tax=Rosa chinensis TaxID=74649 RepID=A0A2P6RI56_ROSCH|nr:early nodulin-like protein 1 [Rosa chinensis]PRQ46112.1 putative cupredoxin [Rosa chinensis]